MRWEDRSGCGAAPFSAAGGLRGLGSVALARGVVGGSRGVFVRVRHHGLRRLAPTLRASVACVGQVDVCPFGVSDPQVLLGCVARPCAAWSSWQVLWPGAAQGPGGCLTRRTRAPRRVLKISCIRAGRAARVSASVRTAGCRHLPSASARIRWRAVLDNTPVVIGSAAGSARWAGPFAWPLADPLRGRGGSGGMAGPGVALPPFLVAGGSLGSGKCGPRPGDVGGGRWGLIRF